MKHTQQSFPHGVFKARFHGPFSVPHRHRLLSSYKQMSQIFNGPPGHPQWQGPDKDFSWRVIYPESKRGLNWQGVHGSGSQRAERGLNENFNGLLTSAPFTQYTQSKSRHQRVACSLTFPLPSLVVEKTLRGSNMNKEEETLVWARSKDKLSFEIGCKWRYGDVNPTDSELT